MLYDMRCYGCTAWEAIVDLTANMLIVPLKVEKKRTFSGTIGTSLVSLHWKR